MDEATCCIAGHFPDVPFPPLPQVATSRQRVKAIKWESLVGRTFGFLAVVSISNQRKGRPGSSYACRCMAPTGEGNGLCGKLLERVRAYDLMHGQMRSCGCASRSMLATVPHV